MKTTIDIPDGMLTEMMRNAKSEMKTDKKRDAVLAAIEEYNRRRRQRRLLRHFGKFKNMMTHEDLMKMREMD